MLESSFPLSEVPNAAAKNRTYPRFSRITEPGTLRTLFKMCKYVNTDEYISFDRFCQRIMMSKIIQRLLSRYSLKEDVYFNRIQG